MKGKLMLYLNLNLKRVSFKRKFAFSLVEVLLSLAIISIVIILSIPVFTKTSNSTFTRFYENTTRKEGVVYTYDKTNIDKDKVNKCLVYVGNNKYSSTNLCSEYEFTVPDGVSYVNLTLVAGGGGGGGASGGTLTKTMITPTALSTENFDGINVDDDGIDISNLRSFTINYMTGHGERGQSPYKKNVSGTFSKVGFFSNINDEYIKINTGGGGRSSAAIYNYTLPEKFYNVEIKNVLEDNNKRFFKFHNYGQTMHFIISKLGVTKDFEEEQAYSSIQTSYLGDGFYTNGISCWLNGQTCINDIPTNNIIFPQEGENMMSIDSIEKIVTKNKRFYKIDTNANLPYIHGVNYGYLEGGEGGRLPYYGEFGAGGKGYPLFCQSIARDKINNEQKCEYNYCYKLQDDDVYKSMSNSSYKNVIDNYPIYCYSPCKNNSNCGVANSDDDSRFVLGQDGTRGMFTVTYVTETRGHIGEGGSAGAVLKVVDFPVKAGETYVIRVGSGGKGGISSAHVQHDVSKTVNVEESNNDVDINSVNYATTQRAQYGDPGVSTSIWKKNTNSESLIYLISGGQGGSPGTNNKTENENEQNSQYLPFLAIGSDDYLKYIDKNIAEIYISTSCSITTPGEEITNKKCLKFPKLYSQKSSNVVKFSNPYQYLNYFSTNTSNLPYVHSFVNFDKNNKIVKVNNTDYLSSFYYKNLIENKIGYVGGLGGFNGFGGKAGCGGLFFGNMNGFNGETGNNAKYHKEGIKKIFMPSEIDNGVGKNYRSYDVLDYYDKCSTLTPNGQSATFVLPDPKNGSYGQAGAGGGGGGYLMSKGAGNGGSGQNGYLMIDWRK